jgi:uncharacterized caspase-like protein
MRAVAAIFLALWLISLHSQPALANKRVALVVGISKYDSVPQLTNPSRDAEAMSALFKKAGFDVVERGRDLGISELRKSIRLFSETSRDADIAVVYYAGHGIEVDGNNYLVPADAKLASDFDVEDETVSLDRVLRALDGAKRLKLVILDACRDNPFVKTMKRSVGTRSVGRGLAKIEPSASDTLVAFAAKAGAVAADGDGQNSPFATALVKYIAEPGLDLRLALGRVRDDVLKTTSHRQEPFVYGSLGGDTVALVPQIAKPVDPEAAARTDYELAAQIGTRQAWDSFLAVHSKGLYAELARAQTNKLIAAEQTRARADDARREAEAQAAKKAEEFRSQLEEQSARQNSEAKQKISEQSRKELEEARRLIAEQAKKELEDAKRQAEMARQEAEAARRQVEEARRQAVADAQKQVEQAKREAALEREKIASLAPEAKTNPAANPAANPTPNPAVPAAPQMDKADIARLLQAHLKRVGCNPGNVDGQWDDGSKAALELFNKNAQTKLSVVVASLDALDSVRGKTDRVCPLVCKKGQRADGDRCVQTVCESGYFLNSGGACEKKPEPAAKPQTATRREPIAREPAASRPAAPAKGGGKCFTFGGKTYCE